MEIRLLGNVEIAGDKGVVRPRRSGERCVLAVLAYHATRPVTITTLVDHLWSGTEQSDKSIDTASTYLRRIRAALTQAGGKAEWLHYDRAARSCVLDIDPAWVDYHRFTTLTTRARQEQEPQLLQEALALWRGPALADIHGHWADHRRHTLHAERLAAYEDLLHHHLAAGQYPEVVRAATDLVEDNTPTDRLLLLGAHGLAGSGQHTAVPAWVARVTQRMRDTVDAAPSADVLDEIDQLITDPAAPASWLSRPDTPALTGTAPVNQREDSPGEQLAQAVATRWRREEEHRHIQDPFPLPVRWQHAPEELADYWENIHGVGAGARSSPLALTGRLDHVVDVYRTVPSGRLVVLGRAGSGKTILTGRFVLDFLKARTGADAVPVVFSVGSWNPTTAPLRDWLTSQLVRDYPGLATSGPGGVTLAAALVQADRILPVLDGFDEIADGLRRAALTALNATRLPLLLTSRTTEYATAVAATDVLSAAAVIELTDLTLTDLADYLPRTTRKPALDTDTTTTVWDPVLTELREHPERRASVNLAAVLTTPLMVALARTIYSDTPDHNPATLLNTDRFDSPEALEDHLVGNFIPTIYQQPGNRPTSEHRRWDPDRVQQWLGYLAAHLDHLGTRDLAWWQLGQTLSRSSRTLLIGLISGLAFGISAGLVWGVVTAFRFGLSLGLQAVLANWLVTGFAAGIAFGLLRWLGIRFISGGAELEPTRVRIQIFRRTRKRHGRFVRRFVVGFAAGALFEVLTSLIVGLVYGVPSVGVNAVVIALAHGLVLGPSVGLMVGLAVGLMTWLEAPIDIRSAVSPTDLLNTNRTTLVILVLTWISTFGIAGWLLGDVGGSVIDFGGPGGIRNGLLRGITIGIVGGGSGAIGYGLSLTAWGQWVSLSRIWLPLTGRLPWAVHAFLDDAYRRGVLRQTGAVYQFRHARLQDHLTQVVMAEDPVRSPGGKRSRRGGSGHARS